MAPLSIGSVKEGNLCCRYHGWSFNHATGSKKTGEIFGVKKGFGGWNGMGMMLHILLCIL